MSNQARPTAVVVDTSRSRYARLRPVPLTAVTLIDDFWSPRLRLNREVMLPIQYRHCEETGRLENFRRAIRSAFNSRCRSAAWRATLT